MDTPTSGCVFFSRLFVTSRRIRSVTTPLAYLSMGWPTQIWSRWHHWAYSFDSVRGHIFSISLVHNAFALFVVSCRTTVFRIKDNFSGSHKLSNIQTWFSCFICVAGLGERIEYNPGSAQKLLGPQCLLEKCDSTCQEAQVSTRISLTTKHIGKGCDRDTYSIQSQRKLCGKC